MGRKNHKKLFKKKHHHKHSGHHRYEDIKQRHDTRPIKSFKKSQASTTQDLAYAVFGGKYYTLSQDSEYLNQCE